MVDTFCDSVFWVIAMLVKIIENNVKGGYYKWEIEFATY